MKNILSHIKLFEDYIGKRMYIVFGLTLASTLSEGFGIVMVLPLLQGIDQKEKRFESQLLNFINDAVRNLGFEQSSATFMLLIGSFFLIKAIFLFSASLYRVRLNSKLSIGLKEKLFENYSVMRYEYYTSRDTGHFLNLITVQTDSFLRAFGGVMDLAAKIVNAITYVTFVFILAWVFGIITMLLGICVFYMLRRLNHSIRQLSRFQAIEMGILSKLVVQTLQGFKYLTATGQFNHLRQESMDSIRRLAKNTLQQEIATSFSATIMEPIVVGSIILIVVIQTELFNQPISPILVSIILFNRGLYAVLGIQNAWQIVLSRIGSVDIVRDELERQNKNHERSGSIKLKKLSDGIDFRNVSFCYSGHHDCAIKNISLKIPALTSVAVVGPSGSGKSTLIDLITLLLQPRNGQLLIDGVPGDEIELASWRALIGYISQDTVIFDDTVANNICMWQGDPASDDSLMHRIREAARQAYIDDFIESLPNGYHTLVGDRGVRLSGGQRQRLFIARELLRKPNVLILDEATSALDSESERKIQKSIDTLKREVTVIIIAHRLSTIRNVDYVVVLDHGSIIESGTYEELKNTKNSRFQKLVAMQSL